MSDAGDVRSSDHLFECKMTGHPGGPEKRPKLLKDFEKIAEEAYAEGRDPVLCLRFWSPSSSLADRDGWVDLTVRRSSEDADIAKELESAIEQYDWLLGRCGGTAP